MSSVRFICGTQDIHKELEKAVAEYFGTEDTILYAACFDANGGVFEPLLTEQDAIISDALNHASIIDGVRLCKAVRYRYANADMAELEARLQEAQAQRFRLIVTDGVFSMDGNVARWTRYMPWPKSTMPWSWWTNATRQASGQDRPRRDGALQHTWQDGNHHRYARQGIWRCYRRFHHRTEGNHRTAAPAFASLPLLELHTAHGGGGGHRDVPHHGLHQRVAGQARARQHRLLCASGCSKPVRHQAYAISHLCRDSTAWTTNLMRTIFDGILRIQGVASTETQISLQEAFQRQVNIDFIEE